MVKSETHKEEEEEATDETFTDELLASHKVPSALREEAVAQLIGECGKLGIAMVAESARSILRSHGWVLSKKMIKNPNDIY